MPGPLPNPNRRRRNQPTIATTALPAGGRQDPAPKQPTWIRLGGAGKAWWRWAWKTPQAAAWPSGSEVVVARRASLEDDMATADSPSAKLAAAREARELDDRLGLTPKAMLALRWSIAPDEVGAARAAKAEEPAPRRRLAAVDHGAVAGA